MNLTCLWLILLMQIILFENGQGFRRNKIFRRRNSIRTTKAIMKNQGKVQDACSDDIGVIAAEVAPNFKKIGPRRIKNQRTREESREEPSSFLGMKKLKKKFAKLKLCIITSKENCKEIESNKPVKNPVKNPKNQEVLNKSNKPPQEKPSGKISCDEIYSKFLRTESSYGSTPPAGLLAVRKTRGRLDYVAFEATSADVQVRDITKKRRNRGSAISDKVTKYLKPNMAPKDDRGHIKPASLLKQNNELNDQPDNFFAQDKSINTAWGSREKDIADFLEMNPGSKVKMEYYFE